jgi:hypothetical protein
MEYVQLAAVDGNAIVQFSFAYSLWSFVLRESHFSSSRSSNQVEPPSAFLRTPSNWQ